MGFESLKLGIGKCGEVEIMAVQTFGFNLKDWQLKERIILIYFFKTLLFKIASSFISKSWVKNDSKIKVNIVLATQ